MKNLNWIMHEINLQRKNGLYYIYIFVTIVYVFLLGYIPLEYKAIVGNVLVITDPTFLGLMFIGSLILLEKNQGIPKGIGISPLGEIGYILGKVLSLLVITLITSLVILIAGGVEITIYRIVGIILCAGIFSLIGVAIGSIAKNINKFIILMTIVSLILILPVLLFFVDGMGIWRGIFPICALINLMFSPEFHMSMLIDFVSLVIWLVGTFYLAKVMARNFIFIK